MSYIKPLGWDGAATIDGLQKDPEYRAAFELAKEDAADILEAEAYRRAVEGVEKSVGWYKGKPGGTVLLYSDVLLMFLLKALRPEKYRERVDVRGVLAHLDLTLLPDHLLARIAAGEHPYSVLAPCQGGAASPTRAAVVKEGDGTLRDMSQDRWDTSQHVEDTFLAKHIELHSVGESLDTSTPHGRFVLTLFGGLAQMERELIGERTRSALAHKRENSQPTSHPPLGFTANGNREGTGNGRPEPTLGSAIPGAPTGSRLSDG